MTREEKNEALNVLTDMANTLHLIPTTRQGKVFKMVLQELQKPEQEPCEDCVRREDALMALTGEYTESRGEILSKAIKRINALSPVTPSYNSIKTELESCTDAISRQAVAEVLLKYAHSAEGKAFAEFLISQINNLPPVTPAEKVGHWIARGLVDINGNRIYECSECHHSDTQAATMIVPYCWYCGSRMIQEVKE